MSNIKTLELARDTTGSVRFLMTGTVHSLVYVERKKKQEHKLAE